MIFFIQQKFRSRLASRLSDSQRHHLATQIDDKPCSQMPAQFGRKFSLTILVVLASEIQRVHETLCQSSSSISQPADFFQAVGSGKRDPLLRFNCSNTLRRRHHCLISWQITLLKDNSSMHRNT